MRFISILLFTWLITGCTSSQSAALGLNTSTVTAYAQNMTNAELCEVLYQGRATTQTLASVGTEFNRRGLTKPWCEEKLNQYYLSSAVDWVIDIATENDDETQTAVTLPAEISNETSSD
ncbi:MAG: hypothetical protein ACPHV3_06725 [Vibrio sp.]